MQNCALDPNLKTSTQDISEDEIRLLAASQNTRKKLHIDSVVSTVQLFKKAVMVEFNNTKAPAL